MGKDSAGKELWRIPLAMGGRWLLSAGVLLVLFSFLIAHSTGSSRMLAYAASAVSFLAAASAISAFARKLGGRRLLFGLLAGFALCLILTLAGLLTDARHMNRDALLSLYSFSFSGALVGSLLAGFERRKGSRALAKFKRKR